MKQIIILCLLIVPYTIFGQKRLKDINAGNLSLGLRTTFSAFNHGSSDNIGMGYGGQFRLQFTDRLNTEWYLDYIASDVSNLASREDVHIGWSVMYYLLETKNFTRMVTPYLLAGHCFDYTRLSDYRQQLETKDRWSAAVQAGLGTHINITPKLDLSATVQYMLHLGEHLEVHTEGHEPLSEPATHSHLSFEKHKGGGLEGHLLFNISLNYKIADLW